MSDTHTQALNLLTQKYPDAVMTFVIQPLSASDFDAQKHKHLSRQALGGAVGVIITPDNKVVLARRNGMHAGWSLPGGTVERGEDFAEAFIREVKEEVGVDVQNARIAQIEKKQFVSPTDERLDFILAVFTAQMKECTLPSPTFDAKAEGLTVALFDQDALPTPMIMGDRQKLEAFGPKSRAGKPQP